MRIVDFCDMKKFEAIMRNWAGSTGLATVAVDAEGNYISDCYNFTDFCIKLTRGTTEGKNRCEKCDREGKGVYYCHAGLCDFGIPITLDDGTVLGSIIGGQVLPDDPDEKKFRATARELGIDEDKYIEALGKVTRKSKEQIDASATLLGDVINMFVRANYEHVRNENIVNKIKEKIEVTSGDIVEANSQINNLANRQKILSLNASIEAARAGEAGRGFAIVADEVQKMSVEMKDSSVKITELLNGLVNSLREVQ
ncbi:MAG: PocR ligand-binding domain-containing protein [Lachnospiraceae bacterium]|nr:PocR ligand-binding domain-containing protein [Lachnospiraceae bacterium]